MSPRVLLNLGCGHVTPAGWINVDGSNRAWLASQLPFVDRTLVALKLVPPTEFARGIQFADFFQRLPWNDDTADAVYMGEVLEHFTQEDGRRLLAECFRILKPGGVLRLRVPDNARFWQNYLQEYQAIKAKPRGEWTTAHARWVSMFFRDICVRPPKSFHSMGHYHKWMYDDVSLILQLEEQGYRAVERAAFHESRIPEIQAVEVRDDLIVEGVKPPASDH
jgi:predicted SAM-dependent methyltransferase